MITAHPDQAAEDHAAITEQRAIDVRGLSKTLWQAGSHPRNHLCSWPRRDFGLIGPDGAGKTSTFQILSGVMEATSGNGTFLAARHARCGPTPDI